MIGASACGGPVKPLKAGDETVYTKHNSDKKDSGVEGRHGGSPQSTESTNEPDASAGIDISLEELERRKDQPSTTPREDRRRCPNCGSTAVDRKTNARTKKIRKHDEDWRCKVCGENFDRPEGQTVLADGGVDLADVACPRCLFSDGDPALGANLCSECGGWFRVDQRGNATPTTGPGRPIADGGHGNYYDVDGEREAEADLERRATVERHEDGGLLITDGGYSTDANDEPEIGDEVEVTFRAEITGIRGVGGHRKAVIDAAGVPGGKIQVYLRDTIDGKYSENYTDHEAADIEVLSSGSDDSAEVADVN
jgi:predicted RNA-binding Zn-ribbon protein involved in translation (DUF1610 family)